MAEIDNKRIAKNTVMLYFRMLLTMGVSLYSTRVILDVLGVEDYGIYNVVGGLVAVFSFLNNAMVASSQRYISYALGKGDIKAQINTYSTSVVIHSIISIAVFVIAGIVGFCLINYSLNIPTERLNAANWVFIMAVASFSINVTSVPYTSSIIAHEKMSIYAWVSIVDALLKLAIVFLVKIVSGDKLITYGFFLLLVSVANRTVYGLYAKHKFAECKFRKPEDKELFKGMLGFAGWSFLGNFAFSAKDYGVNMVVNIFCGVAVNAARGIAYQVMNAINGFVTNFQMAVNPQIIKSFASKDIPAMMTLTMRSCKMSFYLLSLIAVPFFIRLPYVMNLWLVDVPDYSIIFLRLSIIMALINSMAGPVVVAMQATGNIKVFQIVIAIIMLLDIPISYMLLRLGLEPYSVMYVAIGTALVGLIARVLLLNANVSINRGLFFKAFLIQNPIAFLISFVPIFFISKTIPDNFVGLCALCCLSVLLTTIVFYFVSFDKSEKRFVLNKIRSLFTK